MTGIVRIAILGAGKVARDLHVPTIAAHDGFECVCAISTGAGLDGLPAYRSLPEALKQGPAFDAVAVCTPPGGRVDIALDCIDNGLHVLLEKPPATCMAEADRIVAAARHASASVFFAWHSQYATRVPEARAWLARHRLAGGSIRWRENAFEWHKGQDWLWQDGGFGVFDPGINGLSILTALCPASFAVVDAEFERPDGRATPSAARFALRADGVEFAVDLDFLETRGDIWQIRFDSVDGASLTLDSGGAGEQEERVLVAEYRRLYDRFAVLIASGESELDTRPLQIVDEAFRTARWSAVGPLEGW